MFIAHEIRENVDIEDVDAFITLDYEGRFLRRKMLRTDEGEVFLVELSETASLSSEDGLLLNDGRLIGILPKPEKLFKVRHDNLARIAWHIGNRHTPCQMEDDFLLIKEDHVIEKMLQALNCTLERLTLPFTPEGGAYGHGRTLGHSHSH